MKLTTHIDLLLTFGVDGIVTVLPLYGFLASIQTTSVIIRAIKEDEMGWVCGTYGENDLGQGFCGETKWQRPHRRCRNK